MKTFEILRFFWINAIKPYKWWFFLILQAPFLTGFYYLIYTYSIRLIVDIIAQDFNYYEVLYPAFLFVFSEVYVAIIWRISEFASWKSQPFMRRHLISVIMDMMFKKQISFFKEQTSGSLQSRYKTIISDYEEIFHGFGHRLLPRVIICCVATISVINVSFKISLFTFIWSCFFFPVMLRLMKRLQILSSDSANAMHSLNGVVGDCLNNMDAVYIFGRQEHEKMLTSQENTNSWIPKDIKVKKYNFKIQFIGSLFYTSMLVFIICDLLYLKKHNQITIGQFTFVIGLMYSFLDKVWRIVDDMGYFIEKIGNLKASLELFKIDTSSPPSEQFQFGFGEVEFKNVTFSYDPKDGNILYNFNLLIKDNEKVGLVGTSGAGKTTLASLLLNTYPLDEGEILISGQNISNFNTNSVIENISLIPQNINLFNRSILDNIKYGKLDATYEEVVEACKMANIHSFIESLPEGYNTIVGERGSRISGGQKQRIAIARAILKHAQILILDEATSSLDSESEKAIQEALTNLMKDKTVTVIAIAHRLSTLKNMDRIIVLDKGKIIEEGTHNELIKKDGLYKKLWHHQQMI